MGLATKVSVGLVSVLAGVLLPASGGSGFDSFGSTGLASVGFGSEDLEPDNTALGAYCK